MRWRDEGDGQCAHGRDSQFDQHGYAGQKATLTVRDGDKLLAEREMTLAPEGRIQTEPLFFPVGDAGAKSLTFSVEPLPGEENREQQCGDAAHPGKRCEAADSVRGGRAALGVQVYPARGGGGRRCRSSRCCAPAKTRSTGRGSAIPMSWRTGFRRGRGPVRVLRHHYRQGGGGLLYAAAAGIAARVCGPARRGNSVSGRAICRWATGAGRRRA